ncbi:MAG: hypothetical protein IJ733_19840 [Lachnospiraceae bacterium]|nr:hypothetical protein [Lachnospiraceae bacterium]
MNGGASMYNRAELIERFIDNEKIMPIYAKNKEGKVIPDQNVFLATPLSRDAIRRELRTAFPELQFRLVESNYYISTRIWRGFWIKDVED